MALWAAEVDRLLKNARDTFGKPTIYQRPAINGRPAYPAFTITGVPEFLSRLEDVDRGEFFSVYYVLEDFEAATFAASVVATFSATIPPPDGGVLTIDSIGYTAKAALNNAVPFQFFRGTNGSTAAANLTAAINATDGYGGTAYSESTPPHPTCEAFNDSPLASSQDQLSRSRHFRQRHCRAGCHGVVEFRQQNLLRWWTDEGRPDYHRWNPVSSQLRAFAGQ
jgi:hypothetical protein